MTLVTLMFLTIFGAWLLTTPWARQGYHKLKSKTKRAEVDPWATWKAIKANLDKGRAKEHADWQEDFNRLVRATCVHSYPATASSPTYYTCIKCKYVEPWEFVENGCGCRFESHKSLSSPFPEYTVTHRYGNCKWHGVDWPNFNKRSDRSNKPFKSVKDLTR